MPQPVFLPDKYHCRGNQAVGLLDSTKFQHLSDSGIIGYSLEQKCTRVYGSDNGVLQPFWGVISLGWASPFSIGDSRSGRLNQEMVCPGLNQPRSGADWAISAPSWKQEWKRQHKAKGSAMVVGNGETVAGSKM